MPVVPLAQQIAAEFRTLVTQRSKLRNRRDMVRQGRAPQMSVFYHRVADEFPNEWTIGRSRFTDHLDHFQSEFDLISLAELQHRIGQKQCHRLGLAVTFDDGYADNLDFAIPELLRRDIPVCYFVCSGHVEHQRPFRHDVDQRQPLPVHTVRQIRELADAGIEIGSHTVDHVDCGSVTDLDLLLRQIGDDRRRLEDWIGGPVRHFAFPFGTEHQLTPLAIEAARSCGFDSFCSAYGGYNLPTDPVQHIRRFHGDTSMGRLKNWTSYDPSKRRSEPRIDPPPPS